MPASYESYLKGDPEEVATKLHLACQTRNQGGLEPFLTREALLAVRPLHKAPAPLGYAALDLYNTARTLAEKKHRHLIGHIPADQVRRRILPSSMFTVTVPPIDQEPFSPVRIIGARSLQGPNGKKYTFETNGMGDGKLALLNLLLCLGPMIPGQPDLKEGNIFPGQDLKPVAQNLSWTLSDLIHGHTHHKLVDARNVHRVGFRYQLDGRVGFIDKR